MFVRIHKLQVDPKYRQEIEEIEDFVSQWYVPEAGCRTVQFFGDPETGWYGNIAVWDSMEAIEALAQRPELPEIVERVKKIMIDPPTTEIYPVYEPKS